MREILFRGKNDRGEWIEGFYIKDAIETYIYDKYRNIRMQSVILETIGQYTGLIDKNGKKIFEGDIVNEYDMPKKISNTGIVKWSNMFVGWHISQTRSMYCHEYMSYEVIGNIHDNPELLCTPQNDEVRE